MKGEADEILEKLLGIMKSKLAAGEDIMLSGFGKLSVKSKHARRGTNPQTGEPMVLDARKVLPGTRRISMEWAHAPNVNPADLVLP